MSVKVIDNDKKWKEVKRQAKKMDDAYVTVGVHKGQEDYPSGAPVTLVAGVHEYGAPSKNIPSRSYMRTTYDENIKSGDNWSKTIGILEFRTLIGKLSTQAALKKIGLLVTAKIQAKILRLTEPKLEEPTVAARKIAGIGGVSPLVATKKLWGSINYEVKA